MTEPRSRSASRLDDVAGAALLKARPWDVVGAALGVPMLVWGLLAWFGTVGDTGGGVSGFFSGTGAAGIGLVLAASCLMVNQILAGQAHTNAAPPAAVLLAGSSALVILGGVLAKPDSTTLQAGAVTGLLTAITQCVVLTVGWLKGSSKAVKAANVAAMIAQQDAADAAARAGRPYGQPAYPAPGYDQPAYPAPGYGPPAYPPPGYGPPAYPPPGNAQPGYPPPSYSQPGYPQGGPVPPPASYPPPGYRSR
jgi:hypothetical protein